MTKPKKKNQAPTKPIALGKCLECDQVTCPGHRAARRLRSTAEVRVMLMIEYYGWTDLNVN
mgnify:CR=1 FL=1